MDDAVRLPAQGQQGDPHARAILESALDGIIVADAQNVIREFNPSAEAIFGWRREQVVGRDLGLVIPPEMRGRHRLGLDENVRTGQATLLDRRLELEALRADGTRFPIELSVSRSGSKDAPLFTAFIRDITTRRHQASLLLEQSRRLRVLANCQRELAGLTTTTSALYDDMARIAQQAMGADGAAVEIPDGEFLVYRAMRGMAEASPGLRVPRQGSLSGEALDTGQTLVAVDALSDRRVDLAACKAVGIGSMAVGVLKQGSTSVGVIKVMARTAHRFTVDDIPAMDVLVSSLSATLERIERQAALDSSAYIKARIFELQRQLAASDEPVQGIMDALSAHALELTGADGAVVEMLDGPEMVYAACCGQLKGQEGLRLAREGSLSGLCAAEGVLLHSDDTSADPRVDSEACRRLNVASILVAPLIGEDAIVGVLKVVGSRPEMFTPADADVLTSIVQSMGVLIERRNAAEKIAVSERRYRMLFAQNPHPMWVFEFGSLRIQDVNDAAIALYGYSRDEFLGMSILDLRPKEDAGDLKSFLERLETISGATSNYSARHRRKDGSLIEVEVSADDLINEGRRSRLVLAHDVTARRRVEREKAAAEHERTMAQAERNRVLDALEFAASHDSLTGLARFQSLQGWVDSELAAGRTMAFVLVELDRFSAINQTMSHEVADEVLALVGTRLAGEESERVRLCHLSGDEFLALLSSGDHHAISGLADRLRARVAEPIQAGGFLVNLTATVGISVSPHHGQTANELLRRAEAATEGGKAAGRDCVHWFSAQDMQALEDRIVLGGHLRSAIDRSELHLVYQPLFRGMDSDLVGFEALLRWSHPVLGAIPTGRFVPVAEKLGLMTDIGAWVVRQACSQIREWLDAGFSGFKVAVNVSSLQLQRPGLVAIVQDALKTCAVPAQYLELEITESALIENMARVRDKLKRFAEMGVSVALDDFGTGYSSLSYLKHLQLSKLKIDKSFVDGLPGGEKDQAMARTIVSIAHEFGLSVAAEGVETKEQADFLSSIGCDLLQGYLLGRPLDVGQATAILSPKR